MSHELRTPLTGIIGQAELLRAEGGFTPRQAMRLERLTEAGALMRLIIDRVIDVTRPDERIAHPILALCDLDLLARTCRSRIEDDAWAKGLCLTSHVAPANRDRNRSGTSAASVPPHAAAAKRTSA